MSEVVNANPAETTNTADVSTASETVAVEAKVDTSAAQLVSAEKPAETKTETPAEKSVVPEKYDLKLPEGSLLSPTAIEEIAALAKTQKLSNEQAQAILEREHGAVASYVENQKAELESKRDVWLEASKSDKEIGGQALNESVALANRVLNRFATDDLKNTLKATGLGNHPELVRVFSRIGKLMSDDQLVLPGSQAGGSQRSHADILYGTSNQ